ncbi:SEC14 4-like protein [Elysia marginata]|uniref:SEC14 4-like protein n=1 Tax=Elysia marginata TaxID=1093978 RepID=A0AAV4IDP1_9GAST|nr:SEC14 4-like protein [Elysia marginata]
MAKTPETLALGENESGEKEKQKNQRLGRLKSRLAHLTRRPYYNGFLDLSTENLLRWLDASDNCPLLAAARLRASIEQKRKVFKTVLAPSYTHTHVGDKHIGGGLCGVDRQGSLVYFLVFGLTDMRGVVQACSQDQLVVHWAQHIEDMIEALKKRQKDTKKSVHNILLIVDLNGCTTNTFSWTSLGGWLKVGVNCVTLFTT